MTLGWWLVVALGISCVLAGLGCAVVALCRAAALADADHAAVEARAVARLREDFARRQERRHL